MVFFRSRTWYPLTCPLFESSARCCEANRCAVSSPARAAAASLRHAASAARLCAALSRCRAADRRSAPYTRQTVDPERRPPLGSSEPEAQSWRPDGRRVSTLTLYDPDRRCTSWDKIHR